MEHHCTIEDTPRVHSSYCMHGTGGTHIFGRMGMCRSNESLFYKKSLNMGPVFYQKILKHQSTFLNEPKYLGFRMAKTPKITNFLKNGPIFQEKSLHQEISLKKFQEISLHLMRLRDIYIKMCHFNQLRIILYPLCIWHVWLPCCYRQGKMSSKSGQVNNQR